MKVKAGLKSKTEVAHKHHNIVRIRKHINQQ